MRATRRTIRTAVVAAGAAAALALPATAASAASAAAPASAPATVAPATSATSAASVASSASVASAVKVTLPEGRIARLMDGPRVELARPNGRPLAALDRDHLTASADGWTYRIDRSGPFHRFVAVDGRGGSRWVYDFGGRLTEKHRGADASGAVKAGVKRAAAPHGAVRAGAEEAAENTAQRRRIGSAPLVAAGGGLAVLGATSLGFALLRRRTGT